MKTVSARELQQRVKESINLAQRDYVVITRRGMPAAIMVGVEGKDWENVVYETSQSFWKMIQSRRRQKTISLEELEEEIDENLARRLKKGSDAAKRKHGRLAG